MAAVNASSGTSLRPGNSGAWSNGRGAKYRAGSPVARLRRSGV